MKTILLFTLLLCATYSFARNGFVIRGTVEGIENGEICLLSETNHKDTLARSTIDRGKFILTGTTPQEQAAIVRIKNVVNGPVLFLENASYKVQFNVTEAYAPDSNGEFVQVKELENELSASVQGGKTQKIANQYWKILAEVQQEYEHLRSLYTKAEHNGDEKLIEEIEKQEKELRKATLGKIAILVEKNNGSYVSAYILQEYITDLCEDEPETLRNFYNRLIPPAKTSIYGQELEKSIFPGTSEITGILPDFTLTSPDGSPVTLHSTKGKVRILEF